MNIKNVFEILNLTYDDLLEMIDIQPDMLKGILDGTYKLENCEVKTVRKLSEITGMSMEELLNLRPISQKMPAPTEDKIHPNKDYLAAAFTYIRTCIICDLLTMTEQDVIDGIVMSNDIEDMYAEGSYAEALYYLGILDYLCDKNSIPRYPQFDIYRDDKMEHLMEALSGETNALINTSDYEKAIPQLLRFNIFETPETLKKPY